VRGERIVKLRNPWGHQEWNGSWGRHSSLWTAEDRLQYDVRKHDDGYFWMAYTDFLKYFYDIVVCKMHVEFEELRYKDKFGTRTLMPMCPQFSYSVTILQPTWLYTTIVQQCVRKLNKNKEKKWSES